VSNSNYNQTVARLKKSVAAAKGDKKIQGAKKRASSRAKTKLATSKRKNLERKIAVRKNNKQAAEIKKLHKPARSRTGQRYGKIVA
jgi:hypothetical protein